MAALVVTDPKGLVKTARYWYPLLDNGGVTIIRVAEISPGMSVKVAPASVLTCHWTVGDRFPLAAAVKVASCPGYTLRLTG